MSRHLKRWVAAALVWAALVAAPTVSFAQVPWAEFGNGGEQGILPEEVDGWDGEAIRIAHDGNGSVSNGVSWDSAVTGDYSMIEFDFEFMIWNEDESGDADGIGFAYADIDIFGDIAEEEIDPFWGGGEEPNLEGSIGIGFDTWMNNALDLPGAEDATLPNSVSLHYDGQLLVSLVMEEFDLPDDWIQNPTVKRAHIEVVPGDGDGALTMTITDTASDETVVFFDAEPIPDFVPYDGRVVYKARTGGENSNHDVDNISVTHTALDGTRQTVVHYGQHVGPGAGIPGDVNGDGTRDVADIDALLADVRAGNSTQVDIESLVEDPEGFNTYVGDANLDGEFNSTDFVFLFTAGQYDDGVAGNSTWSTGDFNGDGDFDSGDFVAAFSRGGYEVGPRPGVAAVPEPASLTLLAIGLLGLARARRLR